MKKGMFVLSALALLLMALMTGCFASPDEVSTAPTTAPAVTTTTAATTAPAVTTTTAPAEISEFPCTAYATDSLNVRRTPNTDYHAVGGLHANEEVTVIGRQGDFYEIRFKWSDTDENGKAVSGDTAFVAAQYISLNTVTTTRRVITTTARTTATATTAATTAAR